MSESTSPTISVGVNIKGWGVKWGATVGTSGIHVTTEGEPVLTIDAATSNGKNALDGFYLRGQGVTAAEHAGLRIAGQGEAVGGLRIGELGVLDVHGPALDGLGAIFQSYIERLTVHNLDAGDHTRPYVVHINAGPDLIIGSLSAYPVATQSGQNTRVMRSGAGNIVVGSMNLGGPAGEILRASGASDLGTTIKQVNWEPGALQSTPTTLFYTRAKRDRVERVIINGASGTAEVSNVYQVDGGGAYLANPVEKDGGAITNDVVRVNSDLTTPTIFEGESADVFNNTGATLTKPVSCLGDLTTVN